MKIKLPERCFFTVQQLADRWEVSPEEIGHLFETGQLTKRDKMAVIEGLEGAEYINFEIHERPDEDFDLMPRIGPGYCIDGMSHGSEVKVIIYLDEETALLPLAQKYARINDFIEQHFPDSRTPVVLIDDVLEFEKQYAIQERASVSSVMPVNHGVPDAPTALGGQFKTAKLFYSVAELAEILGDKYYRIADGLIAVGARMIFEGKPADISRWERPSPPRHGPDGSTIVYVGVNHGPQPDPKEVIVSVDALPVFWLQSIAAAESADSSTEDASVSDTNMIAKIQKPESRQQRDTTLLKVIAAMLSEWPQHKRPTGKDLEKASEALGAHVSDCSIREAIDKAIAIAPKLNSPTK